MARVVFFSYARRDADTTKAIASGLQQLGQTVWLDQQLSGGQQWWDTILEQIRNCDVFLFVLSKSSLRSKACRAELDYAHRLGRMLLPVSIDHVIDQLLPPYLAETQRVDGADVVQLARALLALPSPPPLPEPLPAPPSVPLSYLDELADSLNNEDLALTEQRNLLGALKQLLREDDEREAAVELLRRLRRHPQVNAWVAEETDAELAKVEPAPLAAESSTNPAAGTPGPASTESAEPMSPPPHASPPQGRRSVVPPAPDRRAGSAHAKPPTGHRPPAPPAPARRRKGRAVMLSALLAVALAGGGVAAAAVTSGSDDTPDPTPVNDDITDPGPTDPGPTDPGPTIPGPTIPEPTIPEPTDPEPTDPETDPQTDPGQADTESLPDACAAGDTSACGDRFTES